MSISSAPTPLEENYNLGLSRCSSWLAQARSLWVEHPFFFLALAALVVVLRRTLDVLGMDVFIIVSYLTDAWIFAWLALGVSRARGGSVREMARVTRPADVAPVGDNDTPDVAPVAADVAPVVVDFETHVAGVVGGYTVTTED